MYKELTQKLNVELEALSMIQETVAYLGLKSSLNVLETEAKLVRFLPI